MPNHLLEKGSPWEIERADVTYPVQFFGSFTKKGLGIGVAKWVGGE